MIEATKTTEKKKFHLALVISVGLLAPLLATSITRAAGLFDTNWQFFVLGLVYAGIALSFAGRSPNRPAAHLAIVYAMIPFGVILDAIVDFFVHHYDRNLWPIEVVILLVFLPIPLAAGVVAGRFVSKRTPDEAQRNPGSLERKPKT